MSEQGMWSSRATRPGPACPPILTIFLPISPNTPQINLDNAVAIFVVGIIIGFFAVLNIIGYGKDVRDRARQRLEVSVTSLHPSQSMHS